MPKVGSDLDSLYQEYLAYLQQQGSAQGFEPSNPFLAVSGSLVVIEAVASGDVNTLKGELEELGLQNSAAAGSTVSGLLPITSIAAMSTLDSLKFSRPAFSSTRGGSLKR